ncbi:hypothetical protein PN36_24830 [Candidatus Thiomargarita nelsonii]|uniref:Uncharacterized protein n=1 Tax=Candidatus Thiomargarita nelsonii TaxID=1003181 RepID=A0A0A6PAL9_9GAMM|nr:hypothetical protein PN36_24830 [Candidatus Thiomargarita nelsonii]
MKTVTREVFFRDLNNQLHQELAKHQIKLKQTITNQVELVEFFEESLHKTQSIVLVIDEFEGIPDAVLSDMMHAFRKMYHRKKYHARNELILVGVSTISVLVMSSASPFNVAEELKISYFTPAEVNQLIEQYVVESGQRFEDRVIKAIYENTKGQPGLVCGLIVQMLEQIATSRTVTMDDFLLTLNYFLKSKYDKNILNIVQKAEEKKAFMCRLLFGEQPIDFNIYAKDIAYLHANGVIENIDDRVGILVPLLGITP